MKAMRLMAALAAALLGCGLASAQSAGGAAPAGPAPAAQPQPSPDLPPPGADPSTVTPAWVTERESAQKGQQGKSGFNIVFVGYDYPILSGALAPSVTNKTGLLNLDLGFEMAEGAGISFLSGVEGECLFGPIGDTTLFLMNDMALFGASLAAGPCRFNLGLRLGFAFADATGPGAADTFTGLGVGLGPEASAYAAPAKGLWLWVRAHALTDWFMDMSDGGSSPITDETNSLSFLSFSAGLAFPM